MFTIEICDEQESLDVDHDRLRRAIEAVLGEAKLRQAELSVALVDDAEIHRLNRQFLDHDYPTDVLSFVLERDADRLEGQIVASAETAARSAAAFYWQPADELLLYVIHGALHLIGYDDGSEDQRAQMRQAEARYLALFELRPRSPEQAGGTSDDS